MGTVYVVGSINNDIVVNAERHPKPGETLHGNGLTYFPGGKGANQAIASARAGARTVMVGMIGSDPAGQDLRHYLEGSGVDVAGVRLTNQVPTGTALITVAQGENTIVVVGGANDLLSPQQLDFPLASGDVVLAQCETPIATTEAAFQKARSVGAWAVFNPAPATNVPTALLEWVDVLIVNQHEYRELFNTEPDVASPQPVGAQTFRGTLVLTLGKDGAVVWSGGQQVARCEGRPVEATDSTGAGDCFVGYLVAGLVQGMQLPQALDRANAAAALSVTRPGAAVSIPVIGEVMATMQQPVQPPVQQPFGQPTQQPFGQPAAQPPTYQPPQEQTLAPPPGYQPQPYQPPQEQPTAPAPYQPPQPQFPQAQPEQTPPQWAPPPAQDTPTQTPPYQPPASWS